MAFDDQPTDEMGRDPAAAATEVAERPLLARNRRLGDGRYVLERPLGHGGMAAVWLAQDVILERPVAVKVLSDTLAGDEEFLTRFRREAQVAAGLSHPSLVGVYDFDAGGERPYLVMEYVAGGDLAERLTQDESPAPGNGSPVPGPAPPDVARLAAELLDALRYIHDAGVLHRDVKPQNVLIGEDGSAKLTDFGIAQPRDATSITQTGKVLGTERYLAPEVMEGKRTSERSDLYALGVVLAEAAREGVSFGVWELIDRLRSDDPHERPGSALAALAELERVSPSAKPVGEPTQAYEPLAAAEPPPPPPPDPSPTPAAPEGDRRGVFASADRRLVIGGLAALAVAVALAVGLALGGDEGDPARDLGVRVQNDDAEGAGQGSATESEQPPPAETTEEPTTDTPTQAADTSASGAELNDQGFALINEGRYDEAIPILQQAVEKLAPIGDLTYAYALYNLGHALRLAGRPEEAIPILEQRLEFPNQRGTVKRELAAAQAEAGVEDSSGPGSGKEPPGNAFGHDD